MAAAPVDYDALRSDWAVFVELLGNERGIRLRLNMPDTIVVKRGQPLAWFVTSKDGYVVQRPAGRSSWEDVRVHLLTCALDESGRYSHYVAVMRGADGTPKLLTRAALDALCEQLGAAAAEGEDSAAAAGAPCVLQAFVPPFLDLRFVTSYTNDGINISCHTFQRRFSRRYLPYRNPNAPQPQPGMLTASPAPEPGKGQAASAAADPAAVGKAAASESSLGGPAGGAADANLGDDISLLDDAALADSERSLGRTLGPVDPALKMVARKAAHGLVQYVQKAHLLTLRGLVCEFVRDSLGHLWFLGPLRADWASLIPGRGGEPWANANLTQQPQDEESWPSTVNEEVEQEDAQVQEQQLETARQAAYEHSHPHMQQLAGGGSLAGPAVEASARSGVPAAVSDRLLPPSALQLPGSQGIGAAAAGSATGSPAVKLAGSPEAAPMSSPPQVQQQHSQHARKTFTRSPGQGSGRKERLQSSSATTGGGGSGWQQAHAHASSPTATCASRGCHPGSPPVRGSVVLTSHLTKELECLREELLIKTDLADALACQAQALEHDKHVITGAFEQVLSGMQGDLSDVRERLEALRLERDRLACQLADVGQRLATAEAERDELRSMLDAERGTAFVSLGQFQKQQEDAGGRAARAEAELRSLQERFREEQAACDALKKLMVFYQHSTGDSSILASMPGDGGRPPMLRGVERPEVKYSETLQDVDELLMRELDPTGERYALSKVLHTSQGDLHAIFLHYCMLDTGFARHWPPQLTLPSWLAFMKDIGSTNLVPGTRTRSDNTMHVQEATEVFRRYCLRQAVMRGAAISVRAPSALGRNEASATAAAAAVSIATGEIQRPGSSQSTLSAAVTSRPFSAASAALAGSTMTYQSFCAALVHVAAKVARGNPEVMDACPFLSEQTRAFIESIMTKAQRVMPIAPSGKKVPTGTPGKAAPTPAGGMGAKEAAAKEAAAKLPKLKKGKSKAAASSGASQEMSAIAEGSRESQLPGS